MILGCQRTFDALCGILAFAAAVLLLSAGRGAAANADEHKPVDYVWRLASSVGAEGENREGDVLSIQLLLNQLVHNEAKLLEPDGVWGPKTAAALASFAKNAKLPGGASSVTEKSETTVALRAAVAKVSLARRVVSVANGEKMFWRNGQRQETDARVATRVRQYWLATNLDYTVDEIQTTKFQSSNPWSAAFVSWVMMRAGAGDQFAYSAAHWRYTAAAKENRVANNKNPFKAYRPTERALKNSTIVVKRRSDSTATYDNVQLGHKTHGDIVVGFDAGEVLTIGGNVGNSVRVTKFPINNKRFIATELHFAVIEVE
ncbi:MAG: hypothetical protein Aurels2KO_41750 [Aureliella sp.]